MDVDALLMTEPDVFIRQRLQADRLWRRVPEELQKETVLACRNLGEEAAAKLTLEYDPIDFRAIAEAHQVRIRKDTQTMTHEAPNFIGGWLPERARISIHAGVAQRLLDLVRSFGFSVTEEDAFRFLFLRTFYPWYAHLNGLLPSQTLDPLPVRSLFRQKEMEMKQADLAARDRFTDCVADFPVPAGLLSYLQLIQGGDTDMQSVKRLLERG